MKRIGGILPDRLRDGYLERYISDCAALESEADMGEYVKILKAAKRGELTPDPGKFSCSKIEQLKKIKYLTEDLGITPTGKRYIKNK